MARVFETSGILRRYAVRPLEWYFEPLGWPERSAAYLEGAVQLFIDAATKALNTAGLKANELDTVVTISSTGIAAPSLEARAAERMGFRADIERVPYLAWLAPAVSAGSRLLLDWHNHDPAASCFWSPLSFVRCLPDSTN